MGPGMYGPWELWPIKKDKKEEMEDSDESHKQTCCQASTNEQAR